MKSSEVCHVILEERGPNADQECEIEVEVSWNTRYDAADDGICAAAEDVTWTARLLPGEMTKAEFEQIDRRAQEFADEVTLRHLQDIDRRRLQELAW